MSDTKQHVHTKQRGSWYWYFEKAKVNGKRQREEKGGYATQQEAYEAGCQAYEHYQNGGRQEHSQRISFSDFLDTWYERTRLYARNNTLEAREKNIRLHLKPKLGSYYLAALSPKLIEEFVREKREAGYSFETVDRMLSCIRTALDYAIWPMELLKDNPARLIRTPGRNFAPLTNREPRRRIEDSELIQIFERYPFANTYHMPLVVGLYFGLRIGEALAASWPLCDFDTGLLAIRQQIQRLSMKGHRSLHYFCEVKTEESRRTLRFEGNVARELARWKHQQAENELYYGADYYYNYLVPAKDYQGRDIQRIVSSPKCLPVAGRKLDLICTQPNGKYIKPCSMAHTCTVIRQMGIHGFDFHCLRCTNLTMLGEDGGTVNEIKARAGHTDYRTSEIYIKTRTDMQSRPIQMLEHKLKGII